jgi:hypothetical protein
MRAASDLTPTPASVDGLLQMRSRSELIILNDLNVLPQSLVWTKGKTVPVLKHHTIKAYNGMAKNVNAFNLGTKWK